MSATWRIIEGDALARLVELPDESVQTCITSPPYYGLRDYGHGGQIGLEATPQAYVDALVRVFREVRRTLRPDGTLWLNLGDSYCSTAPGTRNAPMRMGSATAPEQWANRRADTPPGMKPKDLMGIPWMVAFALRADGWYLRSDVIWSKPNPMPESVRDRPTGAHEYLFLLSKASRYYYDADAIREPATDVGRETGRDGRYEDQRARPPGSSPRTLARLDYAARGRNKRSVWEVSTQPFPGAHFATFPVALVEPCVLAGSPPSCCARCGSPYARVLGPGRLAALGGYYREFLLARPETVGWEPTCEHADEGRAIVLDPFAGAGTTGMVALRHGRSFVGIELNREYVALARRRIHDDAPLLNGAAEMERAA